MKTGANQLVNLEIRAGLRPHPNAVPCSKCGHVWRDGERRHEWHHHLGYAREHWTSAIVLCTTCHAGEHDKAKATHCKHGHEYTPTNTHRRKNGTRECKQCRRNQKKRQRTASWWRARRERVKAHG